MSKGTLKKIEPLLKKPFFTTKEVREKGVHPSSLAYYCKKGMLERISRGVYRSSEREPDVPIEWEDVAFTAASTPTGVVCLVTALSYYELTDEIPRQIWIAVSRESRPPARSNTKVVRMSNMTLGVISTRMGEISVKIFDRERTVIDAFRHLSKEIFIKALQRYVRPSKSHKPDLRKLRSYGKELRADIAPYIEAVTT